MRVRFLEVGSLDGKGTYFVVENCFWDGTDEAFECFFDCDYGLGIVGDGMIN